MTNKYAENDALLQLAKNGDEKSVEKLVALNYSLAVGIARRFTDRGAELDDLIQIGLMGMLKAIRSFDPGRGCMFSTYAVPLIIGEIKRFLRDDGLIKVSREYKKNGAAILRQREIFIYEHGREPQLDELAEICGISFEETVIYLESVTPALSLSDSVGNDGDTTLEDTLSAPSPFEAETDRIAIAQSIKQLPPLWRKIIIMRYFKEMTQQEVASLLGLTQVSISREEKKIYSRLRTLLDAK